MNVLFGWFQFEESIKNHFIFTMNKGKKVVERKIVGKCIVIIKWDVVEHCIHWWQSEWRIESFNDDDKCQSGQLCDYDVNFFS